MFLPGDTALPLTPDAARRERLAAPAFGRVFTDHMAVARWSRERGWHDAKVTLRAPSSFDPATAVFHYAQEIFEGLKAYRHDDDSLWLFRPDMNARRFQESARRMAMPTLPEDLFLESIEALVQTDAAWFPPIDGGALYLRPFMFASEAFLGVKPAREFHYTVLACAVGSYWQGGAKPIDLWVSHDYSRSAPGGTGAVKCGANYAASLAAQVEATRHGCDQVVFLDACERRWVEELGGMNIFFVFDDGSLQTPPLSGTILPGVTRNSVIALARAMGRTVREEAYSIDRWRADAASGRLTECFACGTAAVITAIGTVRGPDYQVIIGGGNVGETTRHVLDRLTAIQRGRADDVEAWMHRIAS